VELHEGWTVQSACKATEDGAAISAPEFHPEGWYKASVPSTVVAVQVAAGEFKDPYYGTRLRDIPGENYPVGHVFSRMPMPEDSPYRCGWWYRREFAVPATDKGHRLWLHFSGINYRADIWVNGTKIADRTQVAGAYRTYDLDVTAAVKPGKANVLAVETFAQTEKDLGINWVDWNPSPPDKDMGLWGPVSLVTSGPVSLRSPFVATHLPDSSLETADLTVYAELHNATDQPISGIVRGTVANVPLSQKITLAPHEDQTVVFTPEQYPQLHLHHPQLWWPRQMGEPHLENLTLRFVESSGAVSDEQSVRVGLREITAEMTPKDYRMFRVNGKPILIRGGGWSPDMLLREDPARLRDEFRLVRDLRLNTIRLEGKLESEDFFHLADEQGILVMAGWCCCDQWEQWKRWTPENYTVAAESVRSQMLRLRNHPSLVMWLNGSDNPPPADVESIYLRVEAETHWPNPIVSSATARPTTVTGKSGVKMTGPYDYVAPSYWYVDTHHGGAYGFNTETSPGPAIPSLASLKQFIPEDGLWPPGKDWAYHMAGGDFADLKVFDGAMGAVLAKPQSLEQYMQFAQMLSYDSERAMFEAYSRNKYDSTGVIQWMLNNAWPSLFWHLFDYYLDGQGSYFGAKKACEPLHIQYSYDDHSIVVVNSTYQPAEHLTASARVYDLHMKEVFSGEKQLDSGADSSTRILQLPDSLYPGDSPIHFVDLTLRGATGQILSRNVYWIPAKNTQFDWSKTQYTHTPAVEHEDLSALLSLPPAHVTAHAQAGHDAEGKLIHLQLQNTSQTIAFQVAAIVRTPAQGLIEPVLWSDDYIELMPGESRTITAQLPADAPADAVVLLSGWNIPAQTLHPGP
jgi:exo-1,4-beta-D-glucosaminidase